MNAANLDGKSAPSRAPFVHCVELDSELVVLDEMNVALHRLNATAALVWERLNGVITVDDIGDEVASVFEIASAAARADVLAVVRDFAARGLLAAHPGGGGDTRHHTSR